MAPTIPVYTLDLQQREPNMRTGSPSSWTQHVVTTDVNAPAAGLTFEHGRATMRITGGNGLQSNRRDFFQIPGTNPWPNWMIRARWASPPPSDGIMEHGYAMNLHRAADGRYKSIVLWHFIAGLLIAGVWDWAADGSGVAVEQFNVLDREVVSASNRTSGLVTATVPAGATSRWRPFDVITADLATASLDGTFMIESVTDTTITWRQAGTDVPAGGAGTIIIAEQGTGGTGSFRNQLASDAVRTDGLVATTGVPLNNPFLLGDWVQIDAADNTYDGRFRITGINPFTGQLTWPQNVANDAGAGQTQVGKLTPYTVRARVLPGASPVLQAACQPDYGVPINLGGAVPPTVSGDSPWEGIHSTTWRIADAPQGPTVAATPGVPCLLFAHGSSNSWAVYDNIEAIRIPSTPNP
jgi:hypothetical protein